VIGTLSLNFPDHADRSLWVNDLEKPALAQSFGIVQMRGKRLESSRGQPYWPHINLGEETVAVS
jgi:hypothetical protein